MHHVTLFVTLLALVGCRDVTRFEDYYPDQSNPEITSPRSRKATAAATW